MFSTLGKSLANEDLDQNEELAIEENDILAACTDEDEDTIKSFFEKPFKSYL